MEQVLEAENLQSAYLAVKANKGAAGVDGLGTEELGGHLRQHWPGIRRKMEQSRYRPDPVKTVTIPKPGGGERHLGIPTVTDRFIQQALLGPLHGIFDPLMSEHSYGFRPGRSAHQAVRQARHYIVEEKKTCVVDIDIRAFFDHLDHDILMRIISEQVRDKRVLKLIGSYLRSKRRDSNGQSHHPGAKGAPQGGPLSPLLGNIYLDQLDRELENRGLSYVRYADDLTIYVKSPRSAERILKSICEWLKRHLKLEVNAEKSRVRPPDQGSFLGFSISEEGDIRLSDKSVERYKTQVRCIWGNRWRVSSRDRIARWREYLLGWWGYFKLVSDREERAFASLSSWTCRHMRKLIWQSWHNWKGRRNALRRMGYSGRALKIAHSSVGDWKMAGVLNFVIKSKHLRSWGMEVPRDLARAEASPQ